MNPLLLGLAGQGALGLYQMHLANQIDDRRPVRKTSEALKETVGDLRNRAYAHIRPGSGREKANIQAAGSNAIQQAKRVGATAADLMQLTAATNQNQLQALAQSAQADAAHQLGQQDRYSQIMGQLSQAQNQNWAWNHGQRYQGNLQAKNALIGASLGNFGNAIGDAASAQMLQVMDPALMRIMMGVPG